MRLYLDESEEEINNCVNCDVQRFINNKYDFQVENVGKKKNFDGNMVFFVFFVMGGGGQVV